MPSSANRDEWGRCEFCQKEFNSQTDYIQVSLIRNYTSQGYPDAFEKEKFRSHITCLPGFRETLNRLGITVTINEVKR